MRAVLLGAPGAGKGTQARRLAEETGMAHLSTGDLLRAAVAAGTPAGERARAFMESGRLVPDEVVVSVLFERLEAPDGPRDFLLDGFPRNRTQAEELDRRLQAAGMGLDVVVELVIPEERLVRRITGRRVCRGCGRNYHVEFLPPKTEGVCDACGGELDQRPDDTEGVVAERLAVYHEQTAPLMSYYEASGRLVSVDADGPVEQVTEALREALGARRGVARG